MTDRSGTTLTRAEDAVAAKALTLHFGDGTVDAAVGDAAPETPAPRLERKRPRPYVAGQPGLFDEEQ